MKFPSKEIVEKIRKEYSVGSRVELVKMDDIQAPPVSTKGTVYGVDDTGSILVHWDNGSSLNVIYEEDYARKLKTVKTICYGKEEIWDSREEAEEFFLQAMMGSEGSECNRYTNIYTKLKMGLNICSDEE